MPYSNSNTTPFDYSTLDSAKPATYNQLKFRVGNVATAVLFSRLDLNRDNFKSANRKIFTQMASALQTATIEKPLTNADLQAIDATGDVTKYRPIFERAFTELYCTPEELHKLLIKDGLSAKKATAAAYAYTILHGDIPLVETVTVESETKTAKKSTAKKSATKKSTVTARTKNVDDKPLKVSATDPIDAAEKQAKFDAFVDMAAELGIDLAALAKS